MENFKKRKKFWATLLVAVLILLATRTQIQGDNDYARVATIQALVEQGTWAIDDFHHKRTVDKLYVSGHFYAAKPPVLSMIGAIIYAPIHNFNLVPLSLTEGGDNFSYYIITLLTVGLAQLLLFVFFIKIMQLLKVPENWGIVLGLVLASGSMLFTFAGTFNNHTVAASLILIGIYFLFKNEIARPESRNIFWAGLALGLAAAIDVIPGGIFFWLVLFYLIFKNKKAYVFYLLGGLPFVFFHYFITYQLIGTVLQQAEDVLFRIFTINFGIEGAVIPWLDYQGSHWANPLGIDSLREPKLLYAFNNIVGSHGFFLYSPLLIFSLFGLAQVRKISPKLWSLAKVVVLAAVLTLLAVIFGTNNYGGTNYGPRYSLALIPVFWIFLGLVIPKIESSIKWRRWFILALVLNIVVASLGLFGPWILSGTPYKIFGRDMYFPLGHGVGWIIDAYKNVWAGNI
jgi:hypothetical protein